MKNIIVVIIASGILLSTYSEEIPPARVADHINISSQDDVKGDTNITDHIRSGHVDNDKDIADHININQSSNVNSSDTNNRVSLTNEMKSYVNLNVLDTNFTGNILRSIGPQALHTATISFSDCDIKLTISTNVLTNWITVSKTVPLQGGAVSLVDKSTLLNQVGVIITNRIAEMTYNTNKNPHKILVEILGSTNAFVRTIKE